MLQRGIAVGGFLVLGYVAAGSLALYGCSAGGPGTGPLVNTATSGATTTGTAAGSNNGAGMTASGSSGAVASGTTTPTSGTTAPTGSTTTGVPTSGATAGATTSSAGGTGVEPSGSGTTGATSGTTGKTGGRPSGPSAGCKATTVPTDTGAAMEYDLVVNVAPEYMQPETDGGPPSKAYVNRKYYVNLPTNWDPTKVYPSVFYGQGCGQTGPEGGPFTTGHFLTDIIYVQLIPATVTGATVVPSNGSPGCFQAGKQGLVDSPDGPYFDLVLAGVESTFCIDTGKVFVAGSSSGAWLTNYLVCSRGNVIAGGAADSGGLQHDHGTCTGGASMMEMPGDSASVMVAGFDIGVAPARDTFIMTNGCSMTPTTMMTFGKAGCLLYGSCSAPVAYCNVGGGHQSGLPDIGDAAWAFWNAMP